MVLPTALLSGRAWRPAQDLQPEPVLPAIRPPCSGGGRLGLGGFAVPWRRRTRSSWPFSTCWCPSSMAFSFPGVGRQIGTRAERGPGLEPDTLRQLRRQGLVAGRIAGGMAGKAACSSGLALVALAAGDSMESISRFARPAPGGAVDGFALIEGVSRDMTPDLWGSGECSRSGGGRR